MATTCIEDGDKQTTKVATTCTEDGDKQTTKAGTAL